MIVRDINVVSEAIKPKPHFGVRALLNHQVAETLYLSSVTVAESLFGIGALPASKRRDLMAQALHGLMGLSRDHVLPLRKWTTRIQAIMAKAASSPRGCRMSQRNRAHSAQKSRSAATKL